MGQTTFRDFKLNQQLLKAVEEAGYSTPTPVQLKAIPLISAGHDILGIAQTGTGKTAAFTLPLLMKVKFAQDLSPRALVIAPTRELVTQLQGEISKLSRFTDIRSVALFGGIGPKTQIELLGNGADILVATPGRFLDLYSRGLIHVKKIKTLVMDEADKMMDMGFMPQIRRILEVIPVKRQNLLFSATMPPSVIKLSEEFLEYPQIVEITPSATVAETVTQYCFAVPNFKTKINLLEYLLRDPQKFNKVIVFVKTKTTADNIYKYLGRSTSGDIRVIHGNKGQNTRMNNLENFKHGEIRILVSTDVSARGIDVSMVSQVINFEVPVVYEDYVHRIGRTGRATNTGEAITFFHPAEEYHLKQIESLINQQITVKPIPQSVEVEKTSHLEQQRINRAIDRQKQLQDPSYKGAFHDKKKPKKSKTKISGRSKKKKGHKTRRYS